MNQSRRRRIQLSWKKPVPHSWRNGSVSRFRGWPWIHRPDSSHLGAQAQRWARAAVCAILFGAYQLVGLAAACAQEKTASAIEDLGGTIRTKDIEGAEQVVDIRIHAECADNSAFMLFGRCRHLRSLRVDGPQFRKADDDGLVNLKHLSELQTLVLYGVYVSDRGLEALTDLKKLELLCVTNYVTDAGFEHVGKLESLKELHYQHAKTGGRWTQVPGSA
jgi:hypothetical protein